MRATFRGDYCRADGLRWGGERLILSIGARIGACDLDRLFQPRPAGAARVFSAAGRRNGDRAFRAAVRHSRRIRILRIAVPSAVVLALLGAVEFALLLNPLRMLAKLPVDLGSIVVSGTQDHDAAAAPCGIHRR